MAGLWLFGVYSVYWVYILVLDEASHTVAFLYWVILTLYIYVSFVNSVFDGFITHYFVLYELNMIKFFNVNVINWL